MWETVIIIILVLLALLFAQRAHYNFISESRNLSKIDELALDQEKLEKELIEYKKRVDALSVKSSFKL